MDGFVAYTAYICEKDGLDLTSRLSVYLDDTDLGISRAESEGYVCEGRVTATGLRAASRFADDSDWLTRPVPDHVSEFIQVVELVDERAAQDGGGVADTELPEGFSEYESDSDRFEPHPSRYVNNRAKEYDDGTRVEFDYRSSDPSGPFEMKPDRVRTVVRLFALGREFSVRRGWEEDW